MRFKVKRRGGKERTRQKHTREGTRAGKRSLTTARTVGNHNDNMKHQTTTTKHMQDEIIKKEKEGKTATDIKTNLRFVSNKLYLTNKHTQTQSTHAQSTIYPRNTSKMSLMSLMSNRLDL
jgi:hypothetical protein